MIVLAIDTAGIDCSAAVFDSSAGRLLSAVSEEIGKGHAERLMAVIDQALDEAAVDLHAVGKIAVVIGPGSFTGIRVGVAAARGLALSLGIDCVGVSTLETLGASHRATSGSDKPVLVAMDAKREEIYAQAFAVDGAALNEPAALSAEDVDNLVKSLSAESTGSWISKTGDRFDIGTVARIGAAKDVAGARPKPLYLRGPDAKPQTGFALARV
ncbi:tRNA (adenosine(37)-N6)-threonylcarbamoyltransferase complex dimerization subunit type 1 TsaB [Rhizobium wenxiniae]|uniref:tRNA threonylcarbamoyl adenosine modification protein YeaZ n=1 Tax=Rhizobium wenxiniae TaxID=1737357 RepID=A0A7X0D0E5_9HYPH|nr:tRNA (adenosine(37)-N6)-threonylcarbamoyltransferase complex dimerization subunit type 1 TsaB [Rhizobium wenxiniae]MBB6162943.1 tRNA threonylcarbamoyl adenosine modification protein YeaZ [Rhizobium wenxiniae]GGF94606.1 tRNA (adenosine(37)-N6)-threonylcarbamoyltransferase complex dimerization subunit type 1 TsaB [Rhizobium wenxiniae]